MNQAHHEVLLNELIDNYTLYCGSPTAEVSEALEVLQQYRDVATQYVSAPDRIKDTALKMVWWLNDKTSVAGHNLSSFQHFICPQYNYQGYCWDRDESLGWLDKLVDLPVNWFHSHIHARTDAQLDGFDPIELQHSPISYSTVYNGRIKFNRFVFPDAASVAKYHTYYLPLIYRTNPEQWVKEVAFTMHFVMDTHVPHHVLGWLFNGHQEWEDELEKKWGSWKVNNMLGLNGSIPQGCSIDYFIRVIASYIYNWSQSNLKSIKDGNILSDTAVYICNQTIRNCGLALNLCVPQIIV